MSTDTDYQVFCDFLEKACGIILGNNKQYLVSSRLKNLLFDLDIESLGQLVEEIKHGSNLSLKEAVIDAMTTNETLWFRDSYPFEFFKQKILPELQKNQSKSIRIWSAACSSGQEPYSISMMVEEYRRAHLGMLKHAVDIVATDVSPSMLEVCKHAQYDTLSLDRGGASSNFLMQGIMGLGVSKIALKTE